ncbi:hypothetical protein EDD85DRAFT_871095 [Armillaria nabsnona]|nr:hypothetical protein EDD85DRAFT_871095 [Armillaria nabsnona]
MRLRFCACMGKKALMHSIVFVCVTKVRCFAFRARQGLYPTSVNVQLSFVSFVRRARRQAGGASEEVRQTRVVGDR